MGIYLKQWAIAEMVIRNGKNLGPQRVKGLPLMTKEQAESVVEKANGNFVVINTLSE